MSITLPAANQIHLSPLYKVKEKGREGNKMKDKSLGIWLIVLFGVTGLAAISLGWLLPWLESERILITLGGVAGVITAVVRALMLRQPADNKRVPLEIEFEKKS
jgi:hypothetical protein